MDGNLTTCVACDKNEATLDPYLCGECAKEFQASIGDIRLFYKFLCVIGRSYLASYTGKTEGGHSYIFSAPAVHFYNARRFHFFCRIAEMAKGVGGDIVECGVEHGQSLLYWLSIAFDSLLQRNVWGFDSFTGPERVDEKDKNSTNEVWLPTPTAYTTETTVAFTNALNAYGLPALWTNSRLTVVPGYFSETLKDYAGDGIAILHLDCNFYESYKTALECLYPHVSPGGIIVFDEYGGTRDRIHFSGAKRAIDEWLASSGESMSRDSTYGKFFCVKRGSAEKK